MFPACHKAEPVYAGDQPGKISSSTSDSDLLIVKPDPADSPKQAAEKLVWSFLVLFENLVSARTLLKSLQEATLLVTPAPGQPPLAKGSETSTAEAFVKKLQVGRASAPVLFQVILPAAEQRRDLVQVTSCSLDTFSEQQ